MCDVMCSISCTLKLFIRGGRVAPWAKTGKHSDPNLIDGTAWKEN